MGAYVTVETAAAELGLTPPTVRYLMLCGKLQIGDAWKREGSRRGTFRVVRKLLDEEKARRGL